MGYLMGYSILVGWLTVATGGLEAALALHYIDDIWASAIHVAFPPAAGAQQSTTVTAADASWQRVIMPVIVVVAYTIWAKASATRNGITTAVPGGRRQAARRAA
jgi:hypothetical protein